MKRLAMFTALGLLVACGDSNGPAPTFAGTWQVVTAGLDSGSLSPATFSVVVTAVGTDSFSINVPTLTWSVGGVQAAVFDSGATVHTFISPSVGFGVNEWASARTQLCQFISFSGFTNTRRDTLSGGGLTVVSGDTIPGGYCVIAANGSVTAHK